MEKLSRVKKYAELRKSIETDNNIDKTLHTEENGALEQEETLKKFDSSIFKKVDIKEDGEYTPVREKKEEPLDMPELLADLCDCIENYLKTGNVEGVGNVGNIGVPPQTPPKT